MKKPKSSLVSVGLALAALVGGLAAHQSPAAATMTGTCGSATGGRGTINSCGDGFGVGWQVEHYWGGYVTPQSSRADGIGFLSYWMPGGGSVAGYGTFICKDSNGNKKIHSSTGDLGVNLSDINCCGGSGGASQCSLVKSWCGTDPSCKSKTVND